MRASGFVLLALAMSCGGSVTIAPNGDGGDDAPSGSGGAGGTSTPTERRVLVVDTSGAPEAGVHVVGHGPSGDVIEATETAADGSAVLTVPFDGMVTVAYETHELQVNATNDVFELRYHVIETLVGPGERDTLRVRLPMARNRTLGPPMKLEIATSSEGNDGDHLQVHTSCESAYMNDSWSPSVDASVYGCEGETAFDLTVFHVDAANNVLGYGAATGLSFLPGESSALGGGSPLVLSPPPFELVFATSDGHPLSRVHIDGWDGVGRHRARSMGALDAVTGNFTAPAPPDDGVVEWRITEVADGGARARHRRTTTLPGSSVWTVAPLAAPSMPSVSLGSTGVPHLTWSSSDGIEDGAVALWQAAGSDIILSSWRLWLPAGTTSIRFPDLPEEIAALSPAASAEQGMSFVVGILEGDRFEIVATGADYEIARSHPVAP